jgi:hypothetical protein
VQSGYKEVFSSRVEFRDASLPGCELGSRGIESILRNMKVQNNGKKGIRLCKEVFMGDLK